MLHEEVQRRRRENDKAKADCSLLSLLYIVSIDFFSTFMPLTGSSDKNPHFLKAPKEVADGLTRRFKC